MLTRAGPVGPFPGVGYGSRMKFIGRFLGRILVHGLFRFLFTTVAGWAVVGVLVTAIVALVAVHAVRDERAG